MLEKLGTLIGILVAVGVWAVAPYLLASSAAVWGFGGLVALSAVVLGGIGQAWGENRANAYKDFAAAVTVADPEPRLASMRAAAIRTEAAYTMASIAADLDADTRNYVESLLDIPALDKPAVSRAHPEVIAGGDGDGSAVRAIMLAIQAGVIRIKSARGRALVCQLLKAEARAVRERHGPNFVAYQENEEYRAALRELKNHLDFRRGVTELIFVGDVCHDRFSLDKDVECWLREQLAAMGVITLFGNHDDHRVTQEYQLKADPSAGKMSTYGDFAWSTKKLKDWIAHEKKVFRHAYFSKSTNILFTHQGLRPGPNGTLWYAGGFLRAADYKDNPEKLVADIQAGKRIKLSEKKGELTRAEKSMIMGILRESSAGRDFIANSDIQTRAPNYTRLEPVEFPNGYPDDLPEDAWWKAPEGVDWQYAAQLAESEAVRVSFQTSFRPSQADCECVSKLLGCGVAHGHDGVADLQKRSALGLNARAGENWDYKPSACAIYAPPNGAVAIRRRRQTWSV